MIRKINPVKEPFLCGAQRPSSDKTMHICNTMVPGGGHRTHVCCCLYKWTTMKNYVPEYELRD